jgi:hypothetical protein
MKILKQSRLPNTVVEAWLGSPCGTEPHAV